MNFKEINTQKTFEVWMKPDEGDIPPTEIMGYIAQDSRSRGYKLTLGSSVWRMRLRDVAPQNDLDFFLHKGCAHLAGVILSAQDGCVLVKVVFFGGDIIEIGDIEVGLDEHIAATAKNNRIRFSDMAALGKFFNDKCQLTVGDEFFFLLMNAPAAKSDFETDQQNEPSTMTRAVPDKQYRQFSIYGDNLRIPVEKRSINHAEIFFATKSILQRDRNLRSELSLARGRLTFSDYSKAGRITVLAAGAMRQLTKAKGSYLRQWDEYGAIEGEMLLARARAVGRIDPRSAIKADKGVAFFVNTLPEQLAIGDEIEVTSEEPAYLSNLAMTWEEYSASLEAAFAVKKERQKGAEEGAGGTMYAPVLEIKLGMIVLDLPLPPAGGMFLILSINGDKIQIERRMQARSAILAGRSANPLLGLLIEENGVLPQGRQGKKMAPLSPFVKDKIFKHDPTVKQIEAINIALNTPDIALIQGPPGTGKTTVITAIIERLNEEYDKTGSIKGRVLVSGFQHDAVENIVARLSINALPAVKFGRRASSSEFADDGVTEKLDNWCADIAKKIRASNPQITQTEKQRTLAELLQSYFIHPSSHALRHLMQRILVLPATVISEEVATQARTIMYSLQETQRQSAPVALRLIRALRVTETSFMDDGPAKVLELLNEVEEALRAEQVAILMKAARWRRGEPLGFLAELKGLRLQLLETYLPVTQFSIEKPREDVLTLGNHVLELLRQQHLGAHKRDAILAEFLHELEDNPDGVREAVEDYNFVYAATTQQAAGKDIQRAKVKYEDKPVTYDTVIIDEAARTSPRDLLIPMAQAEKRIILVGDHRQLPHLIDEEIARVLEDGGAEGTQVNADFVKKSMFEYLFNRLKKLEEEDNIQRTVTLDAQYRTHPMLGKFASDNFYQQYGEAYTSPLPEKYFRQSLQGIENQAAVWVNVPNRLGKEERLSSRSRKRSVEARIIAEYLHKWMTSEEGADLSFGVISFYKAQTVEVYAALQQYGITEPMPDGGWCIHADYRSLPNNEKRLRIGTIDAFQGMEFDVVLLSMVRTQDMNALPSFIRESEKSKQAQQIFGHLMSVNRLCVSMSRQKRALVVVGDGDLVCHDIAETAVPALKNFYRLCQEQGVCL
ncbi:DEAD/DEAH box helicase [Yersinia enterocolitica]